MQEHKSGRLAARFGANRRLNIWYGVLVIVGVIFIARLFYLQVIKHDYYQKQALSGQLKERQIPAERGLIEIYDNGRRVPLVLNQKLYTLYGDPQIIKDSHEVARKLAAITHGNADEYSSLLKTKDTRYVILAKRLNDEQNKNIANLKLPGIGTQAQNYRIYPQGTLAAQLLGFVDSEGRGKYGVEQALDKQLSGTPGQLKAITDAAGVPLAASKENTQIDPQNGDSAVLTIDLSMQKQLENILKAGLERYRSSSGCALIMDPESGSIKAMANYPSYDPAKYFETTDANLFNNGCVSSPLEVGSSMKTLTMSAALDLGVVKKDTTYSDPGKWHLDGHDITNIEEISSGTHSMTDILNQSINTGATWLLMQMGGGEVNSQARSRWYDYMVNHFQLGKLTGIEQGYEAAGTIPDPKEGYALNLTYANTAFGQAMTATPLQMAAALSSIVNGGTYYQPKLVDKTINKNDEETAKKPKVVRSGTVADHVAGSLIEIMEYSVAHHSFSKPFSTNYSVGGKTGTAQIANPGGGYYTDRFNGTYLGFVGGNKVQYVIFVRVNEPRIGGYAGSGAAQPIFGDLAHMLINNFNVLPKTGR